MPETLTNAPIHGFIWSAPSSKGFSKSYPAIFLIDADQSERERPCLPKLIGLNAGCRRCRGWSPVEPDVPDAKACTGTIMPSETTRLLELVPSLRAFAFCLTQDRSEADDLVYGSLCEIWRRHRFKKNTELRIAAFAVVDRQCRIAAPPRPSVLRMSARSPGGKKTPFSVAFEALGRNEREALSLVTVWAFTHEQAAWICGTDRCTLERRVADACVHLTPDLPVPIRANV